VRVHIGASEVMAAMNLREVDGVPVARIRLEEPVVAAYGDRFIIRNVSPSRTLAGGYVINPSPARRFSEDIARLLLGQDRSSQVTGMVRDAGVRGISRKAIAAAFAEVPQAVEKVIVDLMSRGVIIRYDQNNDLYVLAEYAASSGTSWWPGSGSITGRTRHRRHLPRAPPFIHQGERGPEALPQGSHGPGE
jgi:selenocysteine-specific elongation factor